jgi:hypothetical protein
MSFPEPLRYLLNLDGFIIFIEGKKESGKTNLAMLLAEICHTFKYRIKFATNIKTECYYMEEIANYWDLKNWLENEHGKKLYVLDEAGKHIKKMRFMTQQNTLIMDLCQLIRHYDSGLIGVAPSSSFIDSNFLNTDILDARIRKLSKIQAQVKDYLQDQNYFLNDLPKTSIKHNSKDIAPFSMEKNVKVGQMMKCCQFAHWYAIDKTLNKARMRFTPPLHPEEAKRLLLSHIEHTELSHFTSNHEDKNPIQPKPEL